MTANLDHDRQVEEIKVDVLIVGGGFSGLCMAIKLREARMNAFLLEKNDDIAEPGTTTAIPVARATFPRICIPSRSSHRRIGRACIPSSRKFMII